MLRLLAAPGENVGEAQRLQCPKQRVSANPGTGLGGAGQAAEEAGLLTRLAEGIGLRSQEDLRVSGRLRAPSPSSLCTGRSCDSRKCPLVVSRLLSEACPRNYCVLETIFFGTMQRVGSNPTVIEIVFITHIYGIVRVIRKGSITHGLELATGRLA